MKIRLLVPFTLLGAVLIPVGFAAEIAPIAFNTAAVAIDTPADPKQEALYSDGTRAINEGRWSDAAAIFSRIAQQRGERAEASIYWKAYAESKEGKAARALETCTELRRAYPRSKWIDECGALEIEVRSRSGDPVQPQAEQNEELKLLAINSLMQQDEARALPIIEQILNSDNSQKLKDRALFVLAQDQSKQSQEMLTQIARGQKNPALQRKAIQMMAVTNARQAVAMLGDIYRQSSDDAVKKAILESYLITGSPDQLVEAATHETNQRLRQSAVQSLGAMSATTQLLDLYKKSSSEETKSEIIGGLIAAGPKGAEALGTIATTEQNPELRRKAIRNLGIAGGMASAPALLATYKSNPDRETRKAVLQALFLAGDSRDLVELARLEKDPAMKQAIVQQLSLMQSKEATDYMLEILK